MGLSTSGPTVALRMCQMPRRNGQPAGPGSEEKTLTYRATAVWALSGERGTISVSTYRAQRIGVHPICELWEYNNKAHFRRRLHMRKLLLLVSVLLLGASWAVAQDSSSQTDPNSASAAQTSSANAGGETTVQGCLSGSNGSYTLTDKNGTSYQLTGDDAKLSEHVGHEVKITGTSSSASASASGGGTASGAAGGAAASQTLQVSSVKHVSKTCQSGGMSK